MKEFGPVPEDPHTAAFSLLLAEGGEVSRWFYLQWALANLCDTEASEDIEARRKALESVMVCCKTWLKALPK